MEIQRLLNGNTMSCDLSPALIDGTALRITRDCSKQLHYNVPHALPEAWVVIDRELSELHQNRNPSHLFWWTSTGIPFAILLEKAGYLFEEQLHHLRFYFVVIVPELGGGPRPDDTLKHWKSFMTDHHSPVEFSWAWNRGTELPVVRFSFEPIGEVAGTQMDPNNQYAALRFVANQHSQILGCDLLWFNHLWEKLIHFNTPLQRLPTQRRPLSRRPRVEPIPQVASISSTGVEQGRPNVEDLLHACIQSRGRRVLDYVCDQRGDRKSPQLTPVCGERA